MFKTVIVIKAYFVEGRLNSRRFGRALIFNVSKANLQYDNPMKYNHINAMGFILIDSIRLKFNSNCIARVDLHIAQFNIVYDFIGQV